MKKRCLIPFLLFALLLSTAGCGHPPAASVTEDGSDLVLVEDGGGQTVAVRPAPERVVALSSSVAEIWLLAGGELVGVTSDGVEERDLGLSEDVTVVGTVKDPSLESILALQPDLVLLSADISSHISIAQTLRQTQVPHYMTKVETPAEYGKTLEDFTNITGDHDSYRQNGEAVLAEIGALLARIDASPADKPATALFLRAYATGVKVKAREHTVCTILEDIGVGNVADREGFPLEELSAEAILAADPDFVFVVFMGDEESAKATLAASFTHNPVYANLSAIQNDRLILLPKQLYHYKPNNRWGEAYETLLRLVRPDIFAQDAS